MFFSGQVYRHQLTLITLQVAVCSLRRVQLGAWTARSGSEVKVEVRYLKISMKHPSCFKVGSIKIFKNFPPVAAWTSALFAEGRDSLDQGCPGKDFKFRGPGKFFSCFFPWKYLLYFCQGEFLFLFFGLGIVFFVKYTVGLKKNKKQKKYLPGFQGQRGTGRRIHRCQREKKTHWS